MHVLQVRNLHTTFQIDSGAVRAVRGVSFHVGKGETVGIVGESGSGKSVTMLSALKLTPPNARVEAESITFNGTELTHQQAKSMRTMLGKEMAMIFQDPMSSLNPLFTIGDQIMEPLCIHRKLSKEQAKQRAIDLLRLVEIPSPERRLNQYPHEFSGGMRQRVMIAIAIACQPKLLIADEPTTALDVTIQAQILDLLKSFKNKLDTSIIMITHDLGVIATMCNRIIVMYGGTIVEEGTTREIFYSPKHPYTWGLLQSMPRLSATEKTKLIPIPGSPPDLLHPPAGCSFTARCPYAMNICEKLPPPQVTLSETQRASCWLLHPKAQSSAREVVSTWE